MNSKNGSRPVTVWMPSAYPNTYAVKSAYDEINNENENNCYIFHVYIGWNIMHKFIIDWCISTDIFALESLLYTCIWIMEYLSRSYNIMIKRVY